MGLLFIPLLLILLPAILSLYMGRFESEHWDFTPHSPAEGSRVKFTVALKLRNVARMHQHFLDVSNPKSLHYGKFLTARELDHVYGPSIEAKRQVKAFFESMPDTYASIADFGDLMRIDAPVKEVEKHLKTQLGFTKHNLDVISQSALRARTGLEIPDDIAQHISFISLNSPVNHVKARGAKAVSQLKAQEERNGAAATSVPSIVAGNEEAQIVFTAVCSDSSTNINNPPCANLGADQTPLFKFDVYTYTNTPTADTYTINTDPTEFTVTANKVFCFNTATYAACSASADDTTNGCKCVAKLSPLPKYTQLKVNITATFTGSTTTISQGVSNRFALTDVATASFLSDLYSIPKGIQVNYGSNQSVAEFYGEFYSNSDLEKFMYLSGLPNTTIPASNVYGTLPNDQSDPGGEAQLDVEYIMALAPKAATYFYSMNESNPTDPAGTKKEDSNEGFLTYLELVDSQEYPPLVHSLSYGDVEAQVYNLSRNSTAEYVTRCNEEFMQMGLRGLTVLFSSGDDGIGSAIIRKNKALACSRAWPEWPASSPYVTAVGATQMTDKYLPVCGQQYASSFPQTYQLDVQCTGTAETVCTGIFGGVITSGGGFSNISDRATTAPWQDEAVNYYLRSANSAAYPPLTYFNSLGRGYPDVATYGSNYLIYLDGQITRESGTSASAPVFAAMVTLWNDIRLQNNQPPMGFIAPFLYNIYAKNPDTFYDVTTGDNVRLSFFPFCLF